jgi:hypothetical protein
MFRLRFRNQGRVVTLAHERAVGGITLGGSVAVVGEGRGCEALRFELAAFRRRQRPDPGPVFAFVFGVAGLLFVVSSRRSSFLGPGGADVCFDFDRHLGEEGGHGFDHRGRDDFPALVGGFLAALDDHLVVHGGNDAAVFGRRSWIRMSACFMPSAVPPWTGVFTSAVKRSHSLAFSGTRRRRPVRVRTSVTPASAWAWLVPCHWRRRA